MNVKQLKNYISELPDDMEVAEEQNKLLKKLDEDLKKAKENAV